MVTMARGKEGQNGIYSASEANVQHFDAGSAGTTLSTPEASEVTMAVYEELAAAVGARPP